MSESPEVHRHKLPPISIARLAAISTSRASLAAQIEIETLESITATGSDPRARFTPTSRLLKAAADGIASLILTATPQVAGDIRGDVQARLEKLGVPNASAAAVVDQLVSRGVLSTVHQTSIKQAELVTTLLNSPSQQAKDGRI